VANAIVFGLMSPPCVHVIDDTASTVRERDRCARSRDIPAEPGDQRIAARCKEFGRLRNCNIESRRLASDPRVLHFSGFPVQRRLFIHGLIVILDIGKALVLLPPAVPGTLAYISDGLGANCGDAACTTFGTTVTGGGGALKLFVWWDGSHWTLIGK
jgi:hypothetical protein